MQALASSSSNSLQQLQAIDEMAKNLERLKSDPIAGSIINRFEQIEEVFRRSYLGKTSEVTAGLGHIRQCMNQMDAMVCSMRPLTPQQEFVFSTASLKAERLYGQLADQLGRNPSLLKQLGGHIVAICIAIYEVIKVFVPGGSALPPAPQTLLLTRA